MWKKHVVFLVHVLLGSMFDEGRNNNGTDDVMVAG